MTSTEPPHGRRGYVVAYSSDFMPFVRTGLAKRSELSTDLTDC